MPSWQIALAAAGIVVLLILLIGTLLGLIDWSDK
jgi:ABC-type dipeptide/oligopeptide/nickel transport system permease subunit